MRLPSLRSTLLIPAIALTLLHSAAFGADPAAAERQYRIARRLVLEESSEAQAALQKVIELDPEGALVDDALVDQALLLGIPRWPEELGRIEIDAARQARELLTRVTDEFSLADRAAEARYLRALLRLEPLPFHDASDAGLELVTVATAEQPARWSEAARYALGWLAEQQVKEPRALEAYQRLVVDAPFGDASPRAEAGIGRLMLRGGRYDDAARWLQRAREHGAPEELRVDAGIELAVRMALSQAGGDAPSGPAKALVTGTGIRSLVDMVTTPDGGVLLAGEKSATVLRYDAAGQLVGRWALSDLQAIAVSPQGQAFAAAGASLYLLEPDQAPRPVAAQGEFTPVTALAVGGLGELWVLDRKGSSIGRVFPGSGQVTLFAELDREKLASLRWDGTRVVALEEKSRAIVVVESNGSLRSLGAEGLQKPELLASGTGGQLATTDGRAKSILLYDLHGASLGAISWAAAGIEKPIALDLGYDGSVVVFDGANQRCLRVP